MRCLSDAIYKSCSEKVSTIYKKTPVPLYLFSKNVDCNWIKRRIHRRCFLTIFGKSFTSGFIFYFYYFFYYVYYFFMSLSPIFNSLVLLFWYVHLHYFKFHYNDCFQTGIFFSYLRSEIHTLLLRLIIFHTSPFLTKKMCYWILVLLKVVP